MELKSDDLVTENAILRDKVRVLEEMNKLLEEQYRKKFYSGDENATREKLEAIHKGIAEAVTSYSTRIRDSIKAARKFSDERGLGEIGQRIIDIIERALPN